MPEPLLFPAFLYGEQAPTRRKMKAEAKKWGQRFAKGLDFPEPKLIPVPPGSVVFWDHSAVEFMKWGVSTENDPEWEKVCALRGRLVPRWHLYHLTSLRAEIPTPEGADYMEIRPRLWGTYDDFLYRYPWGAITLAIAKPLYHTIPVATRRIDALLSFWEPLDTIRYVSYDLYPVSLTDFVTRTYRDTLVMWVDRPSGDIRADLRTAFATMPTASEDEIQGRALRCAHWFIETWPHLNHREWLKSPGFLERALDKYRQNKDGYEELVVSGPGGLICGLDHRYPEEP